MAECEFPETADGLDLEDEDWADECQVHHSYRNGPDDEVCLWARQHGE